MSRSNSAERRRLLVAEHERLATELRLIERQWVKRHWLGLFGIAALPAYFFSAEVAFAIAVSTPILIAAQTYLLAVRRREAMELREEMTEEIARLDAQPS